LIPACNIDSREREISNIDSRRGRVVAGHGFKIGGSKVNNLRYADDIVLITTTPTELTGVDKQDSNVWQQIWAGDQ